MVEKRWTVEQTRMEVKRFEEVPKQQKAAHEPR
jgi:hypothetical protein